MVKIKDESKWFWNSVRGLCIALVIFIHVTVPLYGDGTVRWEWYFLRRITAFPVAVFFFMAGWFVHFNKIDSKQYLWKKIKRVLVPYLFFSTVYILLNILLGSNANWKGIVASYLLGTSEIQMYYCIYLIQMIILLPLLKRLICSRFRMLYLLMILLISMGIAYVKVYLGMYNSILSPLCLTFLVYYAIGLYVKGYADGRYKSALLDHLRNQKVYIVGLCVCLAFLIALVEGTLTYPDLKIGQISLGNYLYCIAVIALLMCFFWKHGGISCPNLLKPIVWLGEQSFTIYLCHMIVMRPMIILFEKINMAYPWRQLLLFFGTLGCCIIIILLKNKICTKCLVGGKEK